MLKTMLLVFVENTVFDKSLYSHKKSETGASPWFLEEYRS